MVDALSGNIGQYAYVKAQQTSGAYRSAGVEGTSTADATYATRTAQVNTPQFARSAEAAGASKSNANGRDNEGIERFNDNEAIEAEKTRGSLIDISV